MVQLNFKVFLIVCPLVFLAGLVDSIGGGGGLISLPAYLLAGLPIHYATATNKNSSTMGAVVAAYRICKKRTLNWKLILPAILLSLIGSYIGTKLNLATDEKVLEKILLFVLPLVTIVMFLKKQDSKEKEKGLPLKVECLVVWLGALVLGIYDGFYGPGTGTFLMMLFIYVAKKEVLEAAAYTKILNLCSNIVSLTTYLISGKCLLVLGLTAGLCNMVGSYIGSGLVIQNGQKIVKPIIIFVLLLLFLKLLFGW